jgi:hypothetical protein
MEYVLPASSASADRHRSLSTAPKIDFGEVEIVDVVAYGRFAGDVRSWVRYWHERRACDVVLDGYVILAKIL